ncbi:uncharacterized protein K460DRAFT_294389 [Cucurbitaria berberidis CBS 394.84]|uniref:RING-type domain-containing protein n=1 Tax=Cucurbitaria berberidis CBS 394.84 TaxID=1168544 RepID=A0A9P4L4E3_9PLEO|nr:uncharacterized protein K460DRAFT_294389 [Cucurbitaria berberidis CBS 394.84]KAF1840803.1 hypothetical protein K460DRAFT_294389 [Cucurbitaria berberidis CBS 394.84]
MARSGADLGHEVIDLVSDSEDDDQVEPADKLPNPDDPVYNVNAHFDLEDRDTIDLTAIPDIDVPPSDPFMIDDKTSHSNEDSNDWGGDTQLVTEAACLQMVLGVLPDISVDHALEVIHQKTTDATRTIALCEKVVTQLLDGDAYPKEVDEAKNKKRKREDDGDLSDYEKGERDPEATGYEQQASDLLKDEFLSVPIRHITNVLALNKTLFKAYGVLEEQVRNYRRVASPFTITGKSRIKRDFEHKLIERGSQLPKELNAARKKIEIEAAKRRKADEAEQAEEANLQQAQMNNEMGECACCFNDVPLNRMISCNGDTVHFYCSNCPRQQIETQMGQSRYRPKCFGVDDCNGTFSRRFLQQVLSEKTFERLEHMQQLEDLKAAGLDFLSECPFCDFRMECPPVEIDKEFRCQNTKCGKTSCRLCQKDSHIPISCEEAKKDGQLTLRHIVEEAMSAALIRQCNNCKHPFIKDFGCNKMTCTHCKNLQCYVCSKNVTDYKHFGEAQEGKCPLHENIEDRHEQEVQRAADEAMAKVRADNPGLSDADLMVKVSDQVKLAEDARKVRAGADAVVFQQRMGGPIRVPQFVPPAAQYVRPQPFAFARVPDFVQPVHPIQFVHPVGYLGPAPQQLPFQYVYHHPFVPPCPRCHMYHPPNQFC